MSRPVSWRRGLVAALAFVLALPAVTTRLYAADEIEYFAFLRSLWFDQDLSFDNEYRYFVDTGATRDPGFVTTFLEAETATGLRPNYGTLGSAILWAPFYALADAGVTLSRLAGSGTPRDGYARPYLVAVTWASACYGLLALWLSAVVAARLGGRGVPAAVAVGLGTPLIFYMYVAPGMAHATSAFAVALFVWTWLLVRERWSVRGTMWLAASGALMAMVREQEAFLVLVPAVDYVWSLVRAADVSLAVRLRGAGLRFVAAGIAFAVCYLPQAIAYLTLNGRLGPSPVIGAKMHWTSPWSLPVLFSPEHGWVFWTPLVVLAIGGLVMTAVRPPAALRGIGRVASLLLFGLALEVYVTGSVASWTLAGAFGQRRFVGLTVCLVIGLGWLLARAEGPMARRALAAATALFVWWNLGLAFQFGAGWMDRQRLELGLNAWNTFVEVPRQLPSLTYRYLFDRSSFYEVSRRPPPE
jgi:hypothetical protein